MMHTNAIIQARMGSTRLPGKVMRRLHDQTVLGHVVRRLQYASHIDQVVVATSAKASDDVIAAEAERLEVPCYRGSEDDVLARYAGAAAATAADIVLRITSDCPMIDPYLIDAMLVRFKEALAGDNPPDYMSNTRIRRYPRGLDTEIFTRQALETIHALSTQPHEREHVTPYLYQHPEQFRILKHVAEQDHSDLRWTLDTEADWQVISAIYDHLYRPQAPPFTLEEMLAVVERHPELKALNAHIKQKKLG